MLSIGACRAWDWETSCHPWESYPALGAVDWRQWSPGKTRWCSSRSRVGGAFLARWQLADAFRILWRGVEDCKWRSRQALPAHARKWVLSQTPSQTRMPANRPPKEPKASRPHDQCRHSVAKAMCAPIDLYLCVFFFQVSPTKAITLDDRSHPRQNGPIAQSFPPHYIPTSGRNDTPNRLEQSTTRDQSVFTRKRDSGLLSDRPDGPSIEGNLLLSD